MIRSFEAVHFSDMIGLWPCGNMYLQHRSSWALIETKASICLCMLRKGVNLFASLSKITISVHAKSPRSQYYLWYVPQAGLYAFIQSPHDI